MAITAAQLCWLAGILEGEGSFGAKRGSTQKKYPHITMNTTDEDVAKRIFEIFPHGHVRGPYAPRGPLSKKPRWVYQVFEQAQAAGLMMTLYPLMGVRRKEQIRKALAAWRAK